MNILQQLVADAQQKKQQLQNSIGNGIAHIGAAPHPVNTAPAPVVSAIQNAKYGVLAHNPAAQQNFIRQTQAVPQFKPAQQILPTLIHTAPQALEGFGLGLGRSLVGTGQAVSGLYDLATPGLGTNRVSKALDSGAKGIDRFATQQGVTPAYKVGQMTGDTAQFLAPGAILKDASGATKLAKAAQLAKAGKAAEAADLVKAARVAQTGVAGKVAGAVNKYDKAISGMKFSDDLVGRTAQTITKNALHSGGLANTAVGTLQDMGQGASKGQQITPGRIATDIASNAALNLAPALAGQATREVVPGIKSGAKAVNTAIKTAQKNENAATAVGKQLRANAQQRVELTNNLKAAQGRGLNDNHPVVKSLQNQLQQNIQDEYRIKSQSPQRTTLQTARDKLLTAQPGLSMKEVHDPVVEPTSPESQATPAQVSPEPSAQPQLPASRETGGGSSAKPTIEPPARNADAERTALEKLQNGGTNDEAVYAYMKSTGKGLQESVKAVGKAANEAGLTSDGGKNPLLGSVKVPKVQEGDFAQAHHNANYVQGHEQRVGNQATQSFKSLSAKDQNLLRDIEAKPVEEVAKGADNPQAFTQAAKDIRTYYDTRHAYDNYLGMDVGYRANYLRHIFDKADQAASDSQIAIKNGTKTPGYTKARSKDSIASDVLDTLQRDIKGSSYNHAKLTYEKGLNEAFPDKIANGQAVATPTDGQYDQIHHPFGKALFAPKDVAHDINSRTWQQTDSKALETYDKINRGLKYTKLSGGLFHAFTEAGNFAGQQLASGKMLTNPAATGRLAKVFFSKGAMDGEMTRLEANGVADNARLAGLTTTAKEILADAHVGAIDRMKESRWNPLKQMHDATFQREIPYAKMKIFEQKTAGLDAHNPKDLAKMRQVARETNQIFGGIDRMTSGIKPGTFKWLQRGLLATDFTEGKWHTLSDALTSKGPAGNLARQTVAGKAVLFGILATAGGAASGEYNGKSPGDIAKNAAGNLLDPSFQAGSYTAKLPKTHISEAIDAVKPYAQAKGAPWNASGLVHYGQARSAALPSEAIQLLSNKDYYGQPIYGKNTKKAGGGPISPAKVGLNVVNTVAPIPFGQGVSTAQGKQNLPAAIANVAGLNVRQTPANKTATGNTPVDKLKATEKQQNTDLKNSLSAEDYKLSQLSKADRQKLINNGSYTADKFKGLDNYVANEKKQLGMNTGTPAIGVSAKISPHSQKVLGVYNSLNADQNKQKAYSEPSWDYKVAQAKYDNAVANGTLSKAQAISQKQAVQKAKVGSSFSKDTRDLYGLSKQEVYDLITTDRNGKKYAADLLAYGDALKSAGIEKNKFRTSKGAESFGDGTNSATKASSGSKTSLSTLLAGFKTPYSDMVKNSTKGASLARNAHLSKKKA